MLYVNYPHALTFTFTEIHTQYIHNIYITWTCISVTFYLNTGLFNVDSRIHIKINYCTCIIFMQYINIITVKYVQWYKHLNFKKFNSSSCYASTLSLKRFNFTSSVLILLGPSATPNPTNFYLIALTLLSRHTAHNCN